MSVHFHIFYLNEKELNQQVCLIKYAENEISNPTSHKNKRKREREREEQKHNPTSKTFSKTPEKFSLFSCNYLFSIVVITNYQFYHLWSDTDKNLKNKNWC